MNKPKEIFEAFYKVSNFYSLGSVPTELLEPNVKAEHQTSFLSLKNDLRQRFIAQSDFGLIGYGICYEPIYQHAFTDSVLLDYCVTIPPSADGGLHNFLYLTASNSTSKGVEAYVSYEGQNPPEFLIFDWSIPGDNKWALHWDYQRIQPYIFLANIGQYNVPMLRVLNYTEKLKINEWQNRVLLYNPDLKIWDQVYIRPFIVQSDADLKQTDLGFWGPILETRQTDYANLSPMGFAYASLYNDVTQHTFLDTDNTYVRIDSQVNGVDLIHFEPNHTFLVE